MVGLPLREVETTLLHSFNKIYFQLDCLVDIVVSALAVVDVKLPADAFGDVDWIIVFYGFRMGSRGEGSDGAGGTAPKNVTPQADGFNFFHCLVFEPHIAEAVCIPFVNKDMVKKLADIGGENKLLCSEHE